MHSWESSKSPPSVPDGFWGLAQLKAVELATTILGLLVLGTVEWNPLMAGRGVLEVGATVAAGAVITLGSLALVWWAADGLGGKWTGTARSLTVLGTRVGLVASYAVVMWNVGVLGASL